MSNQDEQTNKVVGGDGLVDGETTYGEDIKGNSTAIEAEAPAEVPEAPSEPEEVPETPAETPEQAPAEAPAEPQA